MAENNKGGILNKAEKILRRRKTKVLQSLGKQEKTKDDILAEDCQRLDRQQEVANKFQKDLRHYIHSARALSQASKTFYTTVAETYEPEWENHAQITEILNNMDMLWQDYLQKLTDQVQEPLAKYIANIPQIKARVAKRGRKLIDFDNAKHSLEVHQQAKKKDEAKIAKAKEDLDHVQKIYEDLNNELHHELPEFYHSRVSFYGNLFHDLFSAESVFQTEAGKVWESAPDCSMLMGTEVISSSSEKLATDHKHQTYTPRKNLRNTVVVGSDENLTNGHSDNGAESPRPETPGSKPSTSTPTTPNSPWTAEPVTNGNTDADTSKDSIEDSDENVSAPVKPKEVAEVKASKGEGSRATEKEATIKAEVSSKVNAAAKQTVTIEVKKPHLDEDEKDHEEAKVNGDLDTSTEAEIPDDSPPPVPASPPPEEAAREGKGNKADDDSDHDHDDDDDEEEDGQDDGLYQVPPPAKPVDDDLPAKYLYTVIATHAYKGEDDDELSFDSQEIIYVIDYDDPEEQDPGWLMGVRKINRETGVFPENFTKKV